jgi:hypothetical protein
VRITVHETARAGGTPVHASEDGREAFTLRDDVEPQFDADLIIPVERARELFTAPAMISALRERAATTRSLALGVRLDAGCATRCANFARARRRARGVEEPAEGRGRPLHRAGYQARAARCGTTPRIRWFRSRGPWPT